MPSVKRKTVQPPGDKRRERPEPIQTAVANDDEVWAVETVCAFFGGDKPLNKATLYRAIADGRIPRPINVSASLVRWLGSECRAALVRSIERRDAGERTAPRHGGMKKKVISP
jgi:predicted DNA-binding transcriptional regulator AlpA